MSEAPGRVFGGRYRIDAPIGRSSISDAYRGTDTVAGRPVAIKVFIDESEHTRARFVREAQSTADLDHPNIAVVYDAAHDDDDSYFVMELLEGRPLMQVPFGAVPLPAVLRYAQGILEALAFAHEEDLQHRDLRPSNVMALADGSVKVMDFGFARRTSELSTLFAAGDESATLAYLAPERFLGQATTSRSDLYSAGVILYELLAGSIPFKNDAGDAAAVIFAHVNETPASLRSIAPAVPVELDRIVLRLLEKDPTRRFASAGEALAAVRALPESGGEPNPPTGAGLS